MATGLGSLHTGGDGQSSAEPKSLEMLVVRPIVDCGMYFGGPDCLGFWYLRFCRAVE